MKKWVAKIFFLLAVGLQFSHQVLAHHHHEEMEMAAGQHSEEHDDDDHDTGHFPPHQIDHVFSAHSATISFLKVVVTDIEIIHNWDIPDPVSKLLPNEKRICRYFPPPLHDYYQYFSLRAPPAC